MTEKNGLIMILWKCPYCTETKTNSAINVIGCCTHFIGLDLCQYERTVTIQIILLPRKHIW